MDATKDNKNAWTSKHQDIFGGKAQILQTNASGGNWQFRCYISEENKYVRKSLRTRDKDTAVQRAEKEYLQIYADVVSGERSWKL